MHLLIALAWLAQPAAADCYEQSSAVLRKDVKYCLQGSGPGPVVYFMHGIQTGARAWEDNGYAETARAFASMTFVSFDTESLSYFIDRGMKPEGKGAYETWFTTEFLPYVERKHGVCARRECRGLLGNSMGGLGVLHTSLRHPELFAAVAANSPALLPYTPYEPLELWNAYLDRHPVSRLKGYYLIQDARRAFVTRENYGGHDPIRLVAEEWEKTWGTPHGAPELFLDVGDRDDYGFQEGFALFLPRLQDRGLNVEARIIPGGTHDIAAQPARRASALVFLRDRLAR
jgi:S-formylglutathione hydrolase FrmB